MLIFGAGVVTGGLLVKHTVLAQAPKEPRNNGRPFMDRSPALLRVDFLRRAERELNLSREQKEQADKIIGESQERTRKLIEPISPQIREELEQTKEQFRGLLTADQKMRFEEMLKQQNRPREQRRPGHSTEGPQKQVPAGEPVQK
jgi:hypothetical protein